MRMKVEIVWENTHLRLRRAGKYITTEDREEIQALDIARAIQAEQLLN